MANIRQYFDQQLSLAGTKPEKVETGFRFIDHLSGGLVGSGLFLVMGKPQVGKRSFLHNILFHTSQKNIVSLYLSPHSQKECQSYIKEMSENNNQLNEEDIKNFPVFCDALPSNMQELERMISRMHNTAPLKIVKLDGWLDSFADNLVELKELNEIARKYNIIFFLTIPFEQNANTHFNLEESWQAYAADLPINFINYVLLIDRDEDDQSLAGESAAEFILVKNKDKVGGSCFMGWNGPQLGFKNL